VQEKLGPARPVASGIICLSTIATLLLAIVLVTAGCGYTGKPIAHVVQQSPTGQAQLSASATNVNFGSVNVGSPTAQMVTVTSSANSNVSIAAVASGAGFSVSGSANMVLSPNQSAAIYVNFDPTAAGAATGNLSVTTSSSDNLQIALTGNGVAPPPAAPSPSQQPSVLLQWDPSASAVIGYFVYRGLNAGGPYAKLNGSVDPSSSYSDTTVANGQTYYYAVTSVNSSNVESGYSNQVSVTVP
jgi:Abnormal spindle-like microcephaly-assoc'd, ASPM-SPD-2-Hydin